MDWRSRPVQPVLSAGQLAGLVGDTAPRSGELLFTSIAASRLDEVARWQRLEDLAWCGKVQALVALQSSAEDVAGEFVGDEVALALGVGSMTAGNVLGEALAVAELPGLLEAVQDGRLSVRHVKAVLRTLHEHDDLTGGQRQELVGLLLARLDGDRTPGQLAKLLRRLVLTMDLSAAQQRKQRKDSDRAVHFYSAPDGQAVLHATGPAELIAMVRASLEATLPLHPAATDTRGRAAREFDLFVDMLTGSATPGRWTASVLVPFHTATGGDVELADLPGLGPVLPSTARQLLRQAAATDTVTRVSLDHDGRVTHLDTPHLGTPGARRSSKDRPDRLDLADLLVAFMVPPRPRDLSTGAYRVPDRLRRLVQARDVTCVFPLCDRPASTTDVDHRIAWPRGSTTEVNLQRLCRHHHRAKQAGFTPRLRPDGSTVWTTRGGWQFTRAPKTH